MNLNSLSVSVSLQETITSSVSQESSRLESQCSVVGSYINFKCEDESAPILEQRMGLDDVIVMPNTQNRMGAVLLVQRDRPKCLETYSFGDGLWDGVFEGFVILKVRG
jgi:hypothetical protein